MSNNNFYNITNIKDDNLLVLDFETNKFQYKKSKDVNLNIQNNKYTANYQIKKIKSKQYKLYYKYRKVLKYSNIMLIFSSNKIDNPLFFNIIHILNNKYYLLYINQNKLIYKHIKYNKNYSFINKPKYIFHFIDKNVNICKVHLNNKEYSVYGYNKMPNIRNNKYYCKYNKKLNNSWRVDTFIKPYCKYLNLDKNIKDKLNKCSNNNYTYLLRKLPNELETLDIVRKHLNKMSAGEIEQKINVNKNIIQDKIGNQDTKDMDKKIDNIFTGPYKIILGNTLSNFSLYIEKGNFSDIYQARKEYIRIINTIHERHKEYRLASKFAVCTQPLGFEQILGVSNLIDCQTLCNNKADKCNYVSYDKYNKKCNLYNSCKLYYNKNFDTYTKRSYLRNNGYNLIESIYRLKPSFVNIEETPLWVKFLFYTSAIFITILLSLLLYRFMKIFYKLFACVNDSNCIIPDNIFYSYMLNERYI